jgi:RNase P/RNase MRP subunit POP5
MKAAKKMTPDEYILSVLSPQERLDAALSVAREAFKRRVLKPVDVQGAVKKVRKKVYAERQKKSPSRR